MNKYLRPLFAIVLSVVPALALVISSALASQSSFSASGFSQFCAQNPTTCNKSDFDGRSGSISCPNPNQVIDKVYVHAGDGQLVWELPDSKFSFNFSNNNNTVTVNALEGTHDLSWIGVTCTSATPSPSATPTATPSASPSPTPTATPSASPSPTPSASPSPTPSASPSPSPSASPSPSITPSPTPTIEIDCDGGGECEVIIGSPTPTPTATPTPTPSPTSSPSNNNNSGGSTDSSSGSNNSQPQGQVLGATTLASTGTSTENTALYLGLALILTSVLGFAKNQISKK